MRELSWIAIGYGLFVLQSAAAPELAIAGMAPNFLALGVVASACRANRIPAVVWGAALGLLADCLLPRGIGIGIVCYTVVSWGIQQTLGERGQTRVFLPGVVFAATVAVGLGTLGLTALTDGTTRAWQTWLLPVLGDSLYTALLAAILGIAARPFALKPGPRQQPRFRGGADRWSMLAGHG